MPSHLATGPSLTLSSVIYFLPLYQYAGVVMQNMTQKSHISPKEKCPAKNRAPQNSAPSVTLRYREEKYCDTRNQNGKRPKPTASSTRCKRRANCTHDSHHSSPRCPRQPILLKWPEPTIGKSFHEKILLPKKFCVNDSTPTLNLSKITLHPQTHPHAAAPALAIPPAQVSLSAARVPAEQSGSVACHDPSRSS